MSFCACLRREAKGCSLSYLQSIKGFKKNRGASPDEPLQSSTNYDLHTSHCKGSNRDLYTILHIVKKLHIGASPCPLTQTTPRPLPRIPQVIFLLGSALADQIS